MSQPLFNEDELGIPRGTFAGRQLSPKLDDALAGVVSDNKDDKKAKRVLQRAWRGFLLFVAGIIIGLGIDSMRSAAQSSEYMYGVLTGMGITVMIWVIVWATKKTPAIYKACIRLCKANFRH